MSLHVHTGLFEGWTWNSRKKIYEISVPNVKTDFAIVLFILVKMCTLCVSYTCLGSGIIFKGLQNMLKQTVFAEVPDSEIAWSQPKCWECAVFVPESRPPISSQPGSSSLDRSGLDNIMTRPWSDATWSHTTGTCSNLLLSSVTLLFLERQDKFLVVLFLSVPEDRGARAAHYPFPSLSFDSIEVWI